MDILSLFAERLGELFFDTAKSAEQISKELNHSIYDLYHWASAGNKYMPTVANLVKLSNYFNCSIEFLIGLADENLLKNPIITLPKFSDRFPLIIKAYGLNLYVLGKKTNTSTTTYYRWINQTAAPTIYSLVKISRALGCSIDYLIGRED